MFSYDYDSAISEGGEHGYGPGGDKYEALQKVLFQYAQPQLPPPPPEPPLPPRSAYGNVVFTQMAPLLLSLLDLAFVPTLMIVLTSDLESS